MTSVLTLTIRRATLDVDVAVVDTLCVTIEGGDLSATVWPHLYLAITGTRYHTPKLQQPKWRSVTHMHLRAHIQISAHRNIQKYIHTQTCTHTHTHTHTYASLHANTGTKKRTRTHTKTSMHTRTHTSIHTHRCTQKHTPTYRCTHTYKHVSKQTSSQTSKLTNKSASILDRQNDTLDSDLVSHGIDAGCVALQFVLLLLGLNIPHLQVEVIRSCHLNHKQTVCNHQQQVHCFTYLQQTILPINQSVYFLNKNTV